MGYLAKVVLISVIPGAFIGSACGMNAQCQSLLLRFLSQNYHLVSTNIALFLPKVISIIVVFVLARIAIYALISVLHKYAEHFGKDSKYTMGRSIVRYGVWTLAIVVSLSIAFDNLGVLLTSLGLIGFGITFALQKPILNFMGWVTIMINRTYTNGDRVRINDVRGDVMDIQLMYTTLAGLLQNTDEPSGKIITIPNEMVLTSPIINFTKSGQYVWDELSVSITYESNWNKGVKLLEDSATQVVDQHIKRQHKKVGKHLPIVGNIEALYQEFEKKKGKQKPSHGRKARMERDKKMINEHFENKPIVRVLMKESSISLNVRYLAYYQELMSIKSGINKLFLAKIIRQKDVEIAYPHLQIVSRGKTTKARFS